MSASFDPQKHRRRSIRLKDYDYARAGLYFITICAQNRTCLFGTIADGIMHLNGAGLMLREFWLRLPQRFTAIRIDEYQIMPNHLHGVIEILAPETFSRTNGKDGKNIVLGNMVGAFKSEATNAYIKGVKEHGWPPFAAKLLQRNYWEHIIRDAADYDRICMYMADNPINWGGDSLHQ